MIRYLKARPVLTISICAGAIVWLLLPDAIRQSTRLLLGWDTVTALYLVLVFWTMLHSDTKKIRARAAAQDEGRIMMLGLTSFTAVVSLAAIVAELSTAKELSGIAKSEHIGLAALTVFLSWTFLHTIFAVHYTHEYYSGKDGGLEFPGGDKTPDYWDFMYYSFIIGTAAATADVNILSPIIRRTTMAHCIVAFFFNTTILALTINIGASLL